MGSPSRISRADLKNNLYRIWNRMSSGTYFPPPVRAVEIPKPHGGGTRMLGIPTVTDRIAQTVVALQLEPRTEAIFHEDSYGRRPGRSPQMAVAKCRERCWRKDWVLDLDVQKFFDSVDHDLMVKAVEVNTDQKWVVLYVKRSLEKRRSRCPTGRSSNGTGGPRKGQQYHPSWRTCSCTMPSIPGWSERLPQPWSSKGTPTTQWFTV